MKIRIVGAAAREIAQHVAAYVHPTLNWSEVQVMRECQHGCKLHVRRRGAVLQYALHHSVAYGCRLGRDVQVGDEVERADGTRHRVESKQDWGGSVEVTFADGSKGNLTGTVTVHRG